MPIDTLADAGISDRDLVLRFESLGDNCELGLVQRMVGAEPLGLFRFAGAALRRQIAAMQARFEGMADPENICVQPENDEYMIRLTKYNFVYHAHVKIGEADPAVLHRQQTRAVRFLVDKLIADLEIPEKIMVFRQNEVLTANDLLDFRSALAAYGPVTLLWVQPARPGHPPGRVVAADDTLMIGYVTRLASRDNAPDLDLRSWLAMLRTAHALHSGRSTAPKKQTEVRHVLAPPRRIDAVFGRDGNAGALTVSGWSKPETGFTWAIEDRSVLTLSKPAAAPQYWLEMHVVPFVAPPVLLAQKMGVAVNGELIHTFDPVPRGTVRCVVPARLLNQQEAIEIVLDHPTAARPSEVAGQKDDRRLAVAFHTLSLISD